MSVDTPRIAITLGDPAGIGPEVTVKALARLFEQNPAHWMDRIELHGPKAAIAGKLSRWVPRPEIRAQIEALPIEGHFTAGQFETVRPGTPSAESGEIAWRSIRSALDRIAQHRTGAIVTAPISKYALNAAGHLYPGHTELLAEAAGNVPVRMMLANDELAVVLVSIHVPLRQAIELVTVPNLIETLEITDRHFRTLVGKAPRIAVAGLNPHAGENGLLGREEAEIIAPAIARARSAGIDVEGPFPPDTIFMQARGGQRFDAVIAQYHDQGLIPVKYLGLDQGVNITLGLPFIRTSPDHGTAFDLVGLDRADSSSMEAAIRKADQLLHARNGDDGRLQE